MNWKYEEGRVYCNNEKGELIGEATLVSKENGEIDITHTYVDPKLRGQGIAARMMEEVVRHLREKGLKAIATCSYAYDWFKRNEKMYADVISEDIDHQNAACRIDGKH